MQKFWLAVARGREMRAQSTNESWWCLPFEAAVGDMLLLYCPRQVSATSQGIFAEATVTSSPERSLECAGFGKGAALGRASIVIHHRFKPHLTAKAMKKDALLRHANFIRLNFQGTTFSLDQDVHSRLRVLLSALDDVST
ncbi:hypothetical protein [Burkholderia gladioli]|uniref:hypothetical protein n=1 Tax=Burkholderia gladioli TaxID=28095 RepID=UPI0034DAFCA3